MRASVGINQCHALGQWQTRPCFLSITPVAVVFGSVIVLNSQTKSDIGMTELCDGFRFLCREWEIRFLLFASWETLLHIFFFFFFFHLSQYWKQFFRDWFWCYGSALWIQRHLIDIWAWDGVAMQECAKLPLSMLNSTTLSLLHENAILPMTVTAQMSPCWDSLYLLWKAGWPRRPCESQVASNCLNHCWPVPY